MAHAQKPDFVFRRNGRVRLNRRRVSVQSTTGSRGVRISGSNAGYTIFRSSVKSTGYTIHSPVSPSLSLPCVSVCHHVATGLYDKLVIHQWDTQYLCPNYIYLGNSHYGADCFLRRYLCLSYSTTSNIVSFTVFTQDPLDCALREKNLSNRTHAHTHTHTHTHTHAPTGPVVWMNFAFLLQLCLVIGSSLSV